MNGVIEKISASEPEWLAKTLDEEMSNWGTDTIELKHLFKIMILKEI